MKKVTIVMLLFMFMGAVSLKAQNIDQLVAEGKQWNVVITHVPWPPINRVTDVYKVEGDTMVEGTAYKLLLSTRSEHFTNWELCGLLRENEGQVFHRKYGWNHTFAAENLLYDFSLLPGDTICYNSSCMLLLRISDTILEDGTIRNRYDFQYVADGYLLDEYETWVEGMGSELGLLYPGSRLLVGEISDLLCYYENEDLVWQNPDFNSCFINTDGLGEDVTEAVSVYPNPAKEMITIKGASVDEVKIYNALGHLVKALKNTNEICVSDLQQGLYVLRGTNKDGLSFTKRINIVR